jgi:signal transduction histidine kinase
VRFSRVDIALAVVCAAGVMVAPLLPVAGSARPHGLDAFGVVLFLLAAGAISVVNRWPATVGAVTTGAFVLYHGLGYPGPVFAVGPAVIALFVVAYRGKRRTAILSGAALVVGKLIGGLWLTGGDWPAAIAPVLWISGWLVADLVFGAAMRHRNLYLREVEQRALAAERSREDALARRAGEERLRIARELHDTLTHAISVVNVQSSVALHLLHRKPEMVEPALLAIREASHDAMRELRATLGVLRCADDARPPGLDGLPALAARFEQSGLAVRLRTRGEPVDLPPDTAHAAYRVVQEALTNTARHAAPANVEAAITFHPTHLDLCIDDDGGAGPAPVVEGHGIRGMRERAAALGGTLAVGPRPEGGFRVHATLPLSA